MTGPLHATSGGPGGWPDRTHRSQHSATQAPGREALRRLSALFAEASEILSDLAQSGDIQLDAGAPSSLMDPVTPEPEKPSPGTELLSVDDLADRLKVAPRTVRRWRGEGKLPLGIDLGSVVRWRADAIDAWIAEREEASR